MGAHHLAYPLRHRLQDLITDLMGVSVVDGLEIVEVKEGQRHQRAVLRAG